MRVLIVDDEEKVCSLVNKLIDWEGLGLEPAGIIHDGSEALQFIREHGPEIVITDIRMPGLDGIDIISRIRQLKLDTHFIIISGYRQFEYASNAIKYGVEDYLLKPLKQNDINNVLKRIIAENDQKKAAIEEKETLMERVNQDTTRLKERFLNDVLNGKAISREMLEENYGCTLEAQLFALITLHNLSAFHADGKAGQALMSQKILAIMNDELSDSFSDAVCIPHDSQIVCLVCGTETDFGKMNKVLHRISASMNSLRDIFDDVRFMVAASRPVSDTLYLPQCVDQLHKASAQRLLLPVNSAVEYEPGYEPDIAADELITARQRNDLKVAVSALDDERLSAVVNAIWDGLLARSLFTGWDVQALYFELIRQFLNIAHDDGFRVAGGFQEEVQSIYRQAESVTGLFKALNRLLTGEVMDWQVGKSAEKSKPVRLARKYIHQHYTEPITLETLGNEVGLNATYLSSVFKKETNQSFLDYLTQVRVDAAKELLADTEIPIGDIAERVGYLDMKYFYKRFKKFTGLSPKDYRKLYGQH